MINVTAGVDKITISLIHIASDKIKDKISESLSIHKLELLKKNISRVGNIKTILDPDSITDLSKIFFEKAITFTTSKRVNSASFFPSSHTLIEGGPGQGKSLYLRWLCLNESKDGSRIPIFIEFRNLRYKKTLRKELFNAIRDFGVDLDDDLFDFLANSEKIVFILDGFDEIPNSKRNQAAKDLETIARTYPKLRIIISSRPDSGMGSSVYFKKYQINTLSHENQINFVKHLYSDGDQAKAINNILSSNNFLTEVTNTPLLLTLFTITYNARQFKPDNLAEFYSIIFPTMLHRHDRLKIGYERERKAKLTDYQIQRLFEAFSFVSLKDDKTRFSSPKFREYLALSTKLEGINENLEDALIEDITGITALVIKDGFDDYSFSHKSIQEYFSSVFLKKLNDERKEKFYFSVVNDFNKYRKWQNSLSFLSIIDEGDYTKYFLIPLKKKSLCLDVRGKVNINYKELINMIGDDTKIKVTEDGVIIKMHWGDTYSSSIYKEYSEFIQSVIQTYLTSNNSKIASFISFCDVDDFEKYRSNINEFVISLDAFIRGEKLQKNICRYVSNEFENSSFREDLESLEKRLVSSEKFAEDVLQF